MLVRLLGEAEFGVRPAVDLAEQPPVDGAGLFFSVLPSRQLGLQARLGRNGQVEGGGAAGEQVDHLGCGVVQLAAHSLQGRRHRLSSRA
jgi:hypothetical protein